MLQFILEFVIFGVVTVGSTIPLAKVCQKLKRRHDARKWGIYAGIFAFVAAGLGWSSRSLRADCLAERNTGCVDIGGAGIQLLLVGGFVFWALLSAYLRYNDY